VAGIALERFAAEQTVGLTRFAFLLCGDRQRAEDLVQDALLALYRRFGSELDVKQPLAYARRTITNNYISNQRKKSSSELVTDVLPEIPFAAPEISDMWQVLSAVPERQRAAIVMRYWLDLSDEQIGSVLGCRAGTVRSLLSRGLAALRESAALKELT
jgi:RNA polymerase sigma-70 factor (sigma-E family)